MQSRADAQESEVRTFIKEIRRYATIEELDEAVLNRLISRILIGEVKKVDGQKVSTPKSFDPKTPVKNDRNRRVPERRCSYRRVHLTPG